MRGHVAVNEGKRIAPFVAQLVERMESGGAVEDDTDDGARRRRTVAPSPVAQTLEKK